MIRRLVLSYLIITLVVVTVLTVPLGFQYKQRQTEKVLTLLERDANKLSATIEDDVAKGQIGDRSTAALKAYVDNVPGVRIVAVDQFGQQLADTSPDPVEGKNFASRTEFQTVLVEGKTATGERYSKTLGTSIVYVAVPVASGGKVFGAVRLTFPKDTVDAKVRRYWLALGGVALVSIGTVTLVGVLLARSLAHPIEELEEAATALGSGDLGRRIHRIRGPGEVKALARAFNATGDRLQDVVSRQEAFVADASHQLRTPLTGLRLRLENLEPEINPASLDDLDAAVAEVDRLARMVDGLLALARADRRQSTHTAVAIEVRPMLESRIETWAPFAAERDVTMAVLGKTGLWVLADPDRLSQVLDNLIANALDAVRPGCSITLAGVAHGDDVDLHVIDDGPGLKPEERARAFDRFWRADPRRRSELGGSGLGLAIVAKLVQADGGRARLEASATGGIDAIVTLPGAMLLPPPEARRRPPTRI